MANETNKNETTELTVWTMEVSDNKLLKAVQNVAKKSDTINKGYMSIIGDVAYIIECKAWEMTEYRNKYEMFADMFGMSRGTVSNLENIYKRFGENYAIKEDAKDLSVKQMLRIISAEKKALIEQKESEAETEDLDVSVDGEESTEESAEDETATATKDALVSFDFTIAEDWTVSDLLAELTEAIEKANVESIQRGAHIALTIN